MEEGRSPCEVAGHLGGRLPRNMGKRTRRGKRKTGRHRGEEAVMARGLRQNPV